MSLTLNQIYNIDCVEGLEILIRQGIKINCCVTSPPYYGLRDYKLPKTQWPEVNYSPLPGMPDMHIPEWEGCLGLEPTIEMFVGHIVFVFRLVKEALEKDGTCWVNFGDSYVGSGKGQWQPNKGQKEIYIATKESLQCKMPKKQTGLKPKDLMLIPSRVALALQADGWWVRNDIVWNKPNCMPESATDRLTKAHEYIYLLTKSPNYYFDQEAIKEICVNGDPNPPRGSEGALGNLQKGRREKGNAKTFRGGGAYTKGQSFNNSAEVERESHGNVPNTLGLRNKRSVWNVATDNLGEAHFATFPPKLIEPCILAGSPVNGVVLDPFMGSGTSAMVALQNQRKYIGFELNPEYIEIQNNTRLKNVQLKIV